MVLLNFLAYIYKILGSNLLVGSLLSCVVWFVSALVLRNILIKLKINNKYINLLLSYIHFYFLMIVYSSVTLREVYTFCL